MSAQPFNAPSCDGEHCITCADEGVAMRIRRVDESSGLALCVDEAGQPETVEIALVEPVHVGEWLLVHAGVAIATLAAGDGPALAGAAPRGQR
jgi:hydrogenase expression/formation protein HypC